MSNAAPALTPTVSLFNELSLYLGRDLNAVEEKISTFQSEVPLITQISHHLAQAGGKRIRPILTLLCACLSGARGENAVNLAAALELIHMATLLHDDVVDEGEYRRQLPCARTIWGNQASILVGDYLFSGAFRLMVQSESLPVLRVLSEAACSIAEGEVLQLSHVGDINLTEDAYFKIIRLKTASLFSAACQVGALVGDNRYTKALGHYGEYLGIIFQVIDDLLDYSLEHNHTGKNPGNDLQEKKITLPLICLYKSVNPTEQKALEVILQEGEITAEDQKWVAHLMQTYDVPKQVMESVQKYGIMAQETLKSLPESLEKSFLVRLIDFCSQRVS